MAGNNRLIIMLFMIPMLLMVGFGTIRHEPPQKRLMVYCAAGTRYPMERIAEAYEAETGVRVEVQYGGSGTLLSNLRIAKKGDLFLAADASYIQKADAFGLLAGQMHQPDRWDVARIEPVIVTATGNPYGIRSLKDLLNPELRLSMANPDAASIGHVVRQMLEEQGMWEAFEEQTRMRGVFKPTVNGVAGDVRLGAADAGIIWDATAVQYADLEMIRFGEAECWRQITTIGLLKFSADPDQAANFARFLTAEDRGTPVFEEFEFVPISSGRWHHD